MSNIARQLEIIAQLQATGKLTMWHWLKQRFGSSRAAAQGTFLLGGDSNFGYTTRKGKSIISAAIAATGAEDGDTVAIDREGKALIVGRAPRVVVDNTK